MGFEVVTLWEAYGPAIEQRLDDDVWIVEQAEAGRILLTRDRLRLPRHRDAILIGVLSPVGVVIGAVVSNALPQRALTIAFAGVMLFFAVQLGRRALRKPEEPEPDSSG